MDLGMGVTAMPTRKSCTRSFSTTTTVSRLPPEEITAPYPSYLIAAAPELFDTLAGLVSICEDVFETGLPVDALDTDPYLLDAQDALAQALGEENDE